MKLNVFIFLYFPFFKNNLDDLELSLEDLPVPCKSNIELESAPTLMSRPAKNSFRSMTRHFHIHDPGYGFAFNSSQVPDPDRICRRDPTPRKTNVDPKKLLSVPAIAT